MSATTVLQRCLASALGPMHELRRRTLLLSVESLMAGRRLVLMDLARSWLGAERVRAPLKRLDRLLGNHRLHAERERIYGGMVRWLVRSLRPIILVDWCRLKANGQWHLLRAAVPVGGRTLTSQVPHLGSHFAVCAMPKSLWWRGLTGFLRPGFEISCSNTFSFS